MRATSAILLIALLASLHSPLCIRAVTPADDGVRYIVTLDLCHAGQSGMSVNGTAPFIACHGCQPVSIFPSRLSRIPEQVFRPQLLVYLKERPPQV